MWKPDSQSDRDEKLSRDEAHAEGEAAEAREQAELNPKLAGARTSRRGDPFADSKSTPLNDAFDAKLEVLERMSAALDPSAPKAQGPGPNAGARPPDAMAVLHAAQEPGILFRHEPAPQDGGEEDLEFAAAVAEAAQALAPVPGVLRVRAGRNDAGEKIVLIVVSKGFGEASMRRVPGRFRQFPSLLAVPYELLPLRRSR